MIADDQQNKACGERLQLDFYVGHTNVETRWSLTRTPLGLLSCTLVCLLVAFMMWYLIISMNGDLMSMEERLMMFFKCLLSAVVFCTLAFFRINEPLKFGIERPGKRLYVLNDNEQCLIVVHNEKRYRAPFSSLRHYKRYHGDMFRFKNRHFYIPSSSANDAFSSKLINHIQLQQRDETSSTVTSSS